MDNQQNQLDQQNKTALHIKTIAEFKNEMMLLAINMRLKNANYEVIAAHLNALGYSVQEQTIRTWFMHDGACYATYQKLRQERVEQLQQEGIEIKAKLEEAAVNAVALLYQGMVTGKITKEQRELAKELLAYAGFSKTIKIDQNIKEESASNEKIANALADIAESIKPK